MKYSYSNILPQDVSIEEFYGKLRGWLPKKITRILNGLQFIQGGDLQVFVDHVNLGTDADGQDVGSVKVNFSFEVDIETTDEQKQRIVHVCTHPEEWVEEVYADRFSFYTDAENITYLLEQAVPNKGLMYYGKHNDIGFNSTVKLTKEEKKAALQAWISYGKWI